MSRHRKKRIKRQSTQKPALERLYDQIAADVVEVHANQSRAPEGELRPVGDVPVMVERIEGEQQSSRDSGESQVPAGMTYEEWRWPHLSPLFRATHNKLRVARGLPPIPEPKVDLYKPPPRVIRAFDPNDKDVAAAARQFMGGGGIMGGGSEGFMIDGKPARY